MLHCLLCQNGQHFKKPPGSPVNRRQSGEQLSNAQSPAALLRFKIGHCKSISARKGFTSKVRFCLAHAAQVRHALYGCLNTAQGSACCLGHVEVSKYVGAADNGAL